MKNLILNILLIGTIAIVNAQTEVIKTSQVDKTPQVTENGVVYNTKVKVITEKTKETQFNPAQKHQLNQDRVPSPVTVEKTIMIDNDLDPFYDKKIKVKYFNYKGKKYSFFIDKNSLLVTYKINDADITATRAIKSRNNNYYIIKGNDFNGVGYFNKENDFVIEYYNETTDDTEIAVFENFKL